MAQNDFLDEHVGKVSGYQLTFDALLNKLNTDVYGREMRTDISRSVQALGSAITELHNGDSGVGWTNYQIDLLETILKAAAYADTGIGDEINRLIASLRGAKTLIGLEVTPDTVTLNAGDGLESVRHQIAVKAKFTKGGEDVNDAIDDYRLAGTLIPGKDCPVSVSYTSDGITITKVITAAVRERAPLSMTARLFGNKNHLFIGTAIEEVKDSVCAYILYNDGYQERTTDFTVIGSPIVAGRNYWRVTLNTDPSIFVNLYITGVDPEEDPIILGLYAATIDYLLEECASSYTNNFIETGRTFSTTITTDKGTVKSISVFVDGVSHPGMIDGNTITISSKYIKNRSRIVISAINNNIYTVSYHLTNCTSSNTMESVTDNGAFLTVISPNDGYELDLEKTYIIMGSSKISSTNGRFNIIGVTNNIDVYGVAKAESSGEVTLSSISASYTGGTVAAGTTLEQLTGITVTATYSDGSTATVTGYKLSGNLTAGKTNTITVTYQGKTATFEVTVEAESVDPGVDVIATYGRAEGYRISTSGGTNSALSGCVAVGAKNDATGIIPYKVGDVFYIKGITFPSVETNGSVIVFYSDSNGSHQRNAAQVIYNYENTTFPATFSYSASTGVLTVRINNIMIADSISHPYLRFSLLCSDVSQLKVMKNEVI